MTEHMDKASEAIDWLGVERYLHQSIPHLPADEMVVKQFSEGYSNLTYLLEIGGWKGVLRRPPFGEVPPKAHDMKREFQILEKVHPIFSLAPKPYVYCEDLAVMDKHFYVMEKKEGIVVDHELPEGYGGSRNSGPLISAGVIATLIRLQSVDYEKAGMVSMGKPARFLERQVSGWIRRYEHAKTHEYSHLGDLEEWLRRNLPVTTETTIVHNDFKLNNMVLDTHVPGLIHGVLDWELSTIGDPLLDVGSSIVYWGEAEDPDMGINVVTNQPGFFSRREFAEAYAKESGRDLTDINYYVSFGFYKLAVILQQIHHRWKIGEQKDERFAQLNVAIANLFEMAEEVRLGKML